MSHINDSFLQRNTEIQILSNKAPYHIKNKIMEDKKDNNNQEQKNTNDKQRNSNLALGISIGLLFGLIFDNIALGLCIGVALGVSLRRKKEE